jgi:hypothetical protein
MTCSAAFSQEQSVPIKGTYDYDCSFHTFHLPVKGGSHAKDDLTLKLRWRGGLYPPAWESAGWISTVVTAKKCSARSGLCEDAAEAKIRFEKIGKRILGEFSVRFKDQQNAGSFNVKYHHKGPRIICE